MRTPVLILLEPVKRSEYDHVRPALTRRLASAAETAPVLRADARRHPRSRQPVLDFTYMTDSALQNDTKPVAQAGAIRAALGHRSVVLVGMMGVGKSSIGRRLAVRLGIPFMDADTEIEKAAGMSIPDIFARHGESDFRSGEARVIARLLDAGPQVLATGGGAVMNEGTRAAIRSKGVSVWLSAEFDVLMRRISKRKNDRPMLHTPDPAETLRQLLKVRDPFYALSDLSVQSREGPHEAIVGEIVTALAAYLKVAAPPERKEGA